MPSTFLLLESSVASWLDYTLGFGHLQERKFAQYKVGLQFCQVLNEPLKYFPSVARFCQIWSHWVRCLLNKQAIHLTQKSQLSNRSRSLFN